MNLRVISESLRDCPHPSNQSEVSQAYTIALVRAENVELTFSPFPILTPRTFP